MLSKIQNWLLPFLLFCVCFTGVVQAEEEIQTFLTISASSWNAVMKDLQLIGETASNPAFAAMVEGPTRFFLGKKVMKAADLDAPIGVALQKVKGNKQTGQMLIFCIPVKDPALVIDFLAKRTGEKPDFTEREDGFIDWNGNFLKEINGFTWLVTDERQLPQLDSVDPKTFFGLKDGQSFQLTFDFQAFPEIYTQYAEVFDEGIELALKKEEGESDEAFGQRKKSVMEQRNQMVGILHSLQFFTIGFRMNPAEKSVEMTTAISFLPESPVIQLLKNTSEMKNPFAGFSQAQGMVRGYSVSMGVPSIQEFQKTQLGNALESLRQILGDEEKVLPSQELIEPILNELLGQMETFSGYVLDGKKGSLNLIFALSTGQLAKFQELGVKSLELAKQKIGENFKPEWLQTDVRAHGMTFTRLTAPTEEILPIICKQANVKYDEKELETFKAWFGGTLTFIIGGKENQLYIGLGNDPLTKLGECLNSQPTAHLSESVIDLRGILGYVKDFLVFVQENKLLKAEVRIETKALPTPDEQDGSKATQDEMEKKVEVEITDEDADSPNDLKKIETTVDALLEMMNGVEKTNIRVTVDAAESEIQMKFQGEEAVTKIIGMIPAFMMMNAF